MLKEGSAVNDNQEGLGQPTTSSLNERMTKQKIIYAILFVLSTVGILILAGTVITLIQFSTGVYENPHILIEMFTETDFNPGEDFNEGGNVSWGILAMIYGTFAVGIVALFFALIFGIGSAIFLSEYTPKRIARRIQPVLEFIAALPSVVLGLVAFITLGQLLKSMVDTWTVLVNNLLRWMGVNAGEVNIYVSGSGTILVAGFTVSILAAPIIASISFDAMQSTPSTQRQAVRAFGANTREEFFTVVVPHAKKSIFASVLLGFGRIIGETIIVTVVLGSSPQIHWSVFKNGITMTSAITQFFGEASAFSHLRDTLFFIGLILLIFSFIIVAIAEGISNENKYIMKVIDILYYPFAKLGERIGEFRNRFTSYVEMSEQTLDEQLKTRNRANLRFSVGMGVACLLFIGITTAILSTVLVDAWGYFNLNNDLSNAVGRFVRFVTTRTSTTSLERYEYGILPAIIGSLAVIFLAAILSFPIGTATAIWLYEFSRESRAAKIIRQAIINISAMPSIVVGIFVFAAFSVGMGMEKGVLPGAIALGIMMIPIITTNAIEALRNVPETHKQSALALGATKWEAFRDHRLPYAFPSIITGYILGIARVLGETAPLLFTAFAFNNVVVPTQLTQQPIHLLPVEIFESLTSSTYRGPDGNRFGPVVAPAIAFVLLLMTASLNILAYRIRNWMRSKYEYGGEI